MPGPGIVARAAQRALELGDRRPRPAGCRRGGGAGATASTPPAATASRGEREQRDQHPRGALLGGGGAAAGVRRQVAAEARRADAGARPGLAPSSLGCERGGAAAGVGSNVTQPMPRYQTSTHEWASRSRTTYSFVLVSSEPEVKPVTTRVGHAGHPQQQRHRARELLAVAGLGVEQEALEVVAPPAAASRCRRSRAAGRSAPTATRSSCVSASSPELLRELPRPPVRAALERRQDLRLVERRAVAPDDAAVDRGLDAEGREEHLEDRGAALEAAAVAMAGSAPRKPHQVRRGRSRCPPRGARLSFVDGV